MVKNKDDIKIEKIVEFVSNSTIFFFFFPMMFFCAFKEIVDMIHSNKLEMTFSIYCSVFLILYLFSPKYKNFPHSNKVNENKTEEEIKKEE